MLANEAASESKKIMSNATEKQVLERATVTKTANGNGTKMNLREKLEFDDLESSFVSYSVSRSSSRASQDTFPSTISPNDGSTSSGSSSQNLQLLEEIKLEDHLTRPIQPKVENKIRRDKRKKSRKKRGASLEREISQLIIGTLSGSTDSKPGKETKAKESKTANFILSDLGEEFQEISEISEAPSRGDTVFQGLEDSMRPINNRTVLEPSPPVPVRAAQEAKQSGTPQSAVLPMQPTATISTQASTLLSDTTEQKLDAPTMYEVDENEKDDLFSADFDDDWTAFETSSFFQSSDFSQENAAKESKPKNFVSSSCSVPSSGPATGSSRATQKARIKKVFGKGRPQDDPSAGSLDGVSPRSAFVKTQTPKIKILPLSKQPKIKILPLSKQPRESKSATIQQTDNRPLKVQLPRHRQNLIAW
jgi:hypothetical protein